VHFFLYSWYMLPFILILVILVLGSLAWWTWHFSMIHLGCMFSYTRAVIHYYTENKF
jgi:hypothetical protein